MDDSTHPAQPRRSLSPRLVTLLIIAVYAVVMASTNTRFTILDDESNIIAVSGHPVLPALRLFLAGEGTHELHPPTTDVLLHLWLVSTHYSFFCLRIFANLFFIAGALLAAGSAARIAGNSARIPTLTLMLAWPFAFQYGRITGWYCYSWFLIAWVTWSYLEILTDRRNRSWIVFAAASLLLAWSNYFGFAVLLLLLADLLIFHRKLARKRVVHLLAVIAVIAIAFLPVLWISITDIGRWTQPLAERLDWKNEFAVAAYPLFSIFASAAVAPWYMPLSIPIFLAVLALFASIWCSPGRRWLVNFTLLVFVLQLAGQVSIKRVLFLLPWLFMAMGLAEFGAGSRYPRLARVALVVLVVSGWIGILSGRHYATTNLYEPWGKVAAVVAIDARHGATIVSENPPFFLYLDYQLGLQADTQAAEGAYIGQEVYARHGYTILEPQEDPEPAQALHGKVVVVQGPSSTDAVAWGDAENSALHARCAILGDFRAAPDPAATWKQRFTKDVPILAYRTQVFWYNCP